MGNVTVTQTNPLFNMNGKNLRLWVKRIEYGWFYTQPTDETTDVYELTFTQKDVTFQVVFASGWKPDANPQADVFQQNVEYLMSAFSGGSPLNFYAQYLHPNMQDLGFYTSLGCRFTSLPKGSTSFIALNKRRQCHRGLHDCKSPAVKTRVSVTGR